MNKLIRSICLTAAVALGLSAAQGIERMCMVDMSQGLRHTGGSAPMWDFSGCGIVNGNAPADFAAYGDTLYTEAFAGRRQWFRLRGDTLCWIGEETRSMHLDADSVGSLAETGCLLRARGRYAGMMNVAQEGIMRRTQSRPGILVLCDGDTVRGAVRQDYERTCRTAMSAGEICFPLEADTLPVITSRYSRWVVPGRGPQPVALMYTMSVRGADGEPSDSASWCCMSLAEAGDATTEDEERTGREYTAEETEALLDEVGIATGRGSVTLTFGQWAGPEVSAALTDTYGRLYWSSGCASAAAEMRIDVRGYAGGTYMIVLTAEAGGLPVARKELINIY